MKIYLIRMMTRLDLRMEIQWVMLQGLQSQERNLFLFNDLLLIAKERSSSHFKLKDQVTPPSASASDLNMLQCSIATPQNMLQQTIHTATDNICN